MEPMTVFKSTAAELATQLRHALVDHEAFEILLRPCELQRCGATCCYDGVYLSEEEAGIVTELGTLLRHDFPQYGLSIPEFPVVRARGGRAFKTAVRDAQDGELVADFPSHFPKTRCVFLDEIGRCGLQMLSLDQGMDPWYLKPLTCWIHPIAILPETRERPRPVITVHSKENDPQNKLGYPGFGSCTHCGREEVGGAPAWQVLEAELKALGQLAGRDFYAELAADRIADR